MLESELQNMELVTELAAARVSEIISKYILLLKQSFIKKLVRYLAQSKRDMGPTLCCIFNQLKIYLQLFLVP